MKAATVLVFIICMAAGKIVLSNNPVDTAYQKQNREINKKLILVSSAHVLTYSATLYFLDYLWYRDYPRSSFRFYNDVKGWKQMDKLGHTTTAYHFSKLSYRTFRWSGLNNNKASLWGSISGSLFLTTIELLDGFSSEWGFSWPDIAANTLGSATFLSQQLTWEEQRIIWKYSYSQTGIEKYRPDLLGSNLGENLIKDYNGHTFWISGNMKSIFGLPDGFPGWLNIAIGHGAWGMLGSYSNPEYFNGTPLPEFQRYRQWYIAPDIDLARIDTGSPFFNQLLNTFNFLKLPTPALEYNTQGKWVWHWVFF